MSSKHCCCCGRHLDVPYRLMKPIGRTKNIPYCDNCASQLLIPAIDIARFGYHYEELSESLQLVVRNYYYNKGMSTNCFNKLVDELRLEYEEQLAEYEEDYAEEHKLLEEALLQDE